jgi:hypothetical protein
MDAILELSSAQWLILLLFVSLIGQYVTHCWLRSIGRNK